VHIEQKSEHHQVTKQDQVLEMLANIEELTSKEAERISEIYWSMKFSTRNVLNLYNIFLVLFGDHRAAEEIGKFLKAKNVSFVSEDLRGKTIK
jgi:hypothetical protein